MNECWRKYSIWRTSFALQLSGFYSSCIQCSSPLNSYYLTYPCRFLSRCPAYLEDMMLLRHSHGKFRMISNWFNVQLVDPQFSFCSKLHVPPYNLWIQMSSTLVLIEIRSRKRVSVHKLQDQRAGQALPNQRSWSEDIASVVFSTIEESTKRLYNHRARSHLNRHFTFILNSIYILWTKYPIDPRLHLCIQLFYLLPFDYSITFVVIQIAQLLLLLNIFSY